MMYWLSKRFHFYKNQSELLKEKVRRTAHFPVWPKSVATWNLPTHLLQLDVKKAVFFFYSKLTHSDHLIPLLINPPLFTLREKKKKSEMNWWTFFCCENWKVHLRWNMKQYAAIYHMVLLNRTCPELTEPSSQRNRAPYDSNLGGVRVSVPDTMEGSASQARCTSAQRMERRLGKK